MLSLSKHLYRTAERIEARPRYFGKLSMTVFLLFVYWLAYGQQPTSHVYTYVEQMPELPSGGGMATVLTEFYKQLKFPKQAIKENYGRAMIYVEVGPTGAVQRTRLLRSSGSASLDKALLAAAKLLPHFTAGRQHGQAVTVSLTLPITCLKPQ